MNDVQSRWNVHVELKGLNTEAVTLAGTIKKNLEEVGT